MVRWRAPLGLGMVGADSDDRRGDVVEDDSTCVVESGEDMVDTSGKEGEAMAVLSCNDAGFEGPTMYGRVDAMIHQGHNLSTEGLRYSPSWLLSPSKSIPRTPSSPSIRGSAASGSI